MSSTAGTPGRLTAATTRRAGAATASVCGRFWPQVSLEQQRDRQSVAAWRGHLPAGARCLRPGSEAGDSREGVNSNVSFPGIGDVSCFRQDRGSSGPVVFQLPFAPRLLSNRPQHDSGTTAKSFAPANSSGETSSRCESAIGGPGHALVAAPLHSGARSGIICRSCRRYRCNSVSSMKT